MTEKAILSGSPKLPSDLKGHKTHPKKPSHGKAKQSLHLSPACCSCVAVPGLRAALTHSSCSQRDGAAPWNGAGRVPSRRNTGFGSYKAQGKNGRIRPCAFSASSGHSPPPRAHTLSLLLQAGGSFCSSHPQGRDMESFCPYCWGMPHSSLTFSLPPVFKPVQDLCFSPFSLWQF